MKNKEELQELLTLYKTVMEAWKLRSQLRVSVKRKINLLELLEMVEDEIDQLMPRDEELQRIKEKVSTPQVKIWVPEDEEIKKTDKYILMRHTVTNEDAMVSEHYIELMDERGYRIVKT